MEKQGIFMFRPSVDLKVIRDKACLVKSQIFFDESWREICFAEICHRPDRKL
jgi:hypothetical protein